MTIVLNEIAKREKPSRPHKMQDSLFVYLQANSPSLNFYVDVRDALLYAEEQGVNINWQAHNIDAAFTWADTPQGDEYWSNIHERLEYPND